MGFGYLFLGYLISFVLYLTANALSPILGSIVLLLGYTAMLLGLLELKKYCRTFQFAAFSDLLLMMTAIWKLLASVSDTFLWNVSFHSNLADTVLNWCDFAFMMLFHAGLLSAIREISLQVELQKNANAALRNSVFVGMYGILYLMIQLPIGNEITKYFNLFMTICLALYVLLNLLLLLSCTKNICPEGKEEPEEKRYKWNFLNKIGDKFAQTQENAVERSRRDVEDYLKKQQEKRNQSLQTQHKRKRRK